MRVDGKALIPETVHDRGRGDRRAGAVAGHDVDAEAVRLARGVDDLGAERELDRRVRAEGSTDGVGEPVGVDPALLGTERLDRHAADSWDVRCPALATDRSCELLTEVVRGRADDLARRRRDVVEHGRHRGVPRLQLVRREQ